MRINVSIVLGAAHYLRGEIGEAWAHPGHWGWSFQIDDRLPVENVQTGARSEEQALIEARHEAIAAIKALDARP